MTPFKPESIFANMKEKTVEAVKNTFTINGKKNSLVVEDVTITDDKDPLNFPEQNTAKDKGNTWGVPVHAKISLINNASGNRISTQKIKIADLPKITGRHSFLVKGDEYQVQHQFRRAPGVYTRVADNGHIEAVVGGGMQKQFRMGFNPDSRELHMQLDPDSTSVAPIIPMLHMAGVTEDALHKTFGKEIVQANTTKKHMEKAKTALTKLAGGVPVVPGQHASQVLNTHLDKWKLTPAVVEDVLGKPKNSFDVEALALTAHKLIGVSKGTVVPSTYDNVGHKQFLDPGDILYDTLTRTKVKTQIKLRGKIDRATDVSEAIGSNTLTKPIEQFFRNSGKDASGLSMRADQINPLAMIVGASQTTVMGAGGISEVVGSGINTSQLVHGSHIGHLDPLDTGEKKESGLTLPLPLGAQKTGSTISAQLFNLKTRKMELVPALVSYKAYIALPDDVAFSGGTYQPTTKDKLVRASVPGGKVERASFAKIQYVMPSAIQQFGLATNMLPFLNNNNGNRMMMAAKHARQAVALLDKEEPLVQVTSSPGSTFEKDVGKAVAHVANADGVVEKITKEQIVVTDAKGQKHITYLYDRFITTEKKTALNSVPIVKVGDKVKKGQVIADQTFTKNGTLTLGTNLHIGYMPMQGYNFEDGVVISESAATKLTSVHTYPIDIEFAVPVGTLFKSTSELESLDFGSEVASKSLYQGWCAVSAGKLNLTNISDDGIVKEGVTIHPGEPLALAIRKSRPDSALAGMRGMTKKAKPQWARADTLWEYGVIGKVTKVFKNGKKIRILVETKEKMSLGDKLVGRYGNKGVVTKILPDKEMPFVKQGNTSKPLEVIMNPIGIPGRINPGQVYELAAAKIAQKTGKVYEVTNFDQHTPDMTSKLEKELKKHGLSDTDDVYDPQHGYVGKVTTGPQYIQKLVHQVDKKLGARAGGASLSGSYKYTPDKQPARGDGTGGQSLSALGLYALLGHNARMNIQELQTHKSTYENDPTDRTGYNSDDFWMSLMSGAPLPPPKPTFAYSKFLGHLKGMGVNIVKNGNELQMVPLTDKELLSEKPHEVKDPAKILKGKSAEPDTGGLFDFPQGGMDSKKWGYLKLAEPLPNPVMESAIETLLDLGKGGVTSVMKGEKKVGNATGGIAIQKALAAIDPTKEIDKLKTLLTSKIPADQKDKLYKKIKLLNNLKKLKVSPDEAYVTNYMPILPPVFRPIGLSAAGSIEQADINSLYKTTGLANAALREFDPAGLPEKRDALRGELYDSLKMTYLNGMPNSRGDHISGLMQSIAKKPGGQSKDAMYQAKIVKRRSDLSGRGVIIPEPALTLDEVGLPRKMAMEIYKPFIVRELSAMGYSHLEALSLAESDPQNPSVKLALDKAVSTRPVMIKRDPVLHKYGILAFKPQIHEGKAMMIHPLVCSGFNADFDGDTMATFVPASDKAVEEARKMLPSNNLFSSTTFKLMNMPAAEMIYGIYQMSEMGKKTNLTFPTIAAVVESYHGKKTGLTDQVKVGSNLTNAGRCMLYNSLTSSVKADPLAQKILYGPTLTKKQLDEFLSTVARTHKSDYPTILDAWKNLGNKYATLLGSSFALKDFRSYSGIRDKHLAAADAAVSKIKNVTDRDKTDIYLKAADTITKEVAQAAKADNNSWYKWTEGSGASKKWNQITQLVASPLMVVSGDGGVVPEPIRKSYAEGLSTADYWTAVNGVRTGTLSRAKETMEPGAQAKRIMNLGVNLPVTKEDCGTTEGIFISTGQVDAEGRYLAGDVEKYKAGELVTSEVLLSVRDKHPQIKVRSPLKCKLLDGVCAKCCGINEDGQLHRKGMNMGVLAGQAMSEPLTQMSMNSFHTGGSAMGAGAKAAGEFESVQQLLNIPKPESMKVKATITQKSGKITRIYPDTAAGGFFITVDDAPYRVPTGLKILVKVGDSVTAGQPLSEGPVSPHELLQATDIDTVRGYLVDSLHEIYDKKGVRRRNIETIVKNLTNTVRVTKDPTFEYTPDEVISETEAKKENESRKQDNLPPIEYKNEIKGISEAAKAIGGTDWLARMNHIGLEQVIKTGVTHGYVSNIHGAHPIAGMVYGAEFGEGQEDWEY
jgi:DNA-directed RNA polymerase subunit beta'